MNIRVMLALVCLAGWLSTAIAGQGVDVDVNVTEQPQAGQPPASGEVIQVMAQRWESYDEEVTEMVPRTRIVRKWRLVDYPVNFTIPTPGPQPSEVVIQDSTVCPPCEQGRTSVQVDVPAQPSPPDPPECIGGRCFQRIIGNRADGTRVDVNVDTRPRGLFWRFRR